MGRAAQRLVDEAIGQGQERKTNANLATFRRQL